MSILNLDDKLSKELLKREGWEHWRSHESFKKTIRWKFKRWNSYHDFYLVNGVKGWSLSCYGHDRQIPVNDYTDVMIHIQNIQNMYDQANDMRSRGIVSTPVSDYFEKCGA